LPLSLSLSLSALHLRACVLCPLSLPLSCLCPWWVCRGVPPDWPLALLLSSSSWRDSGDKKPRLTTEKAARAARGRARGGRVEEGEGGWCSDAAGGVGGTRETMTSRRHTRATSLVPPAPAPAPGPTRSSCFFRHQTCGTGFFQRQARGGRRRRFRPWQPVH